MPGEASRLTHAPWRKAPPDVRTGGAYSQGSSPGRTDPARVGGGVAQVSGPAVSLVRAHARSAELSDEPVPVVIGALATGAQVPRASPGQGRDRAQGAAAELSGMRATRPDMHMEREWSQQGCMTMFCCAAPPAVWPYKACTGHGRLPRAGRESLRPRFDSAPVLAGGAGLAVSLPL